jgi:hypothetical protein
MIALSQDMEKVRLAVTAAGIVGDPQNVPWLLDLMAIPGLARIAGESFRSSLAWDRGEIFWGDERCVPPDHTDSNYRMTRETLLGAVPIPPERVHRIEAERLDHAGAAAAYEAEIARVLGDAGAGRRPPSTWSCSA